MLSPDNRLFWIYYLKLSPEGVISCYILSIIGIIIGLVIGNIREAAFGYIEKKLSLITKISARLDRYVLIK